MCWCYFAIQIHQLMLSLFYYTYDVKSQYLYHYFFIETTVIFCITNKKQICSSGSFDEDEVKKITTEMSSLMKVLIIDNELCVCEYGLGYSWQRLCSFLNNLGHWKKSAVSSPIRNRGPDTFCQIIFCHRPKVFCLMKYIELKHQHVCSPRSRQMQTYRLFSN